MTKSILVVAAHSDDEALGCAGVIAKHIDDGDEVTVMFMTDGISSRGNSGCAAGELRKKAAIDALNILGVTSVKHYDFPDNQMDTIALLEVTQAVEEVLKETSVSVVYTHFANDLNVDHRITHQAVMTACRPQVSSYVREIYSFEVLSSTEWQSKESHPFQPNLVVDITLYWDKKLSSLRCYDKEMHSFPHSRSYECVEALAILRGATHGFQKAEAFVVERILK